MKNKQGVSPLIATVLIIGFTIALAAVVMIWGETFLNEIDTLEDRTTTTIEPTTTTIESTTTTLEEVVNETTNETIT